MLKNSKIYKEIQTILENKNNSNIYVKKDYINNKEYKQLEKEYIKLYSQIDRMLNESSQLKLDSLTEVIWEMADFNIKYAYKIGLVDGIKIKMN